MLLPIFTVIYRNIKRNASATLFNAFSLAIGMACFILIMLWVQYETSYENFNSKANRTYRLAVKGVLNDKSVNNCQTSKVALDIISNLLSEIENTTSILDFGECLLSKPNSEAFRMRALASNEHFFDVFGIKPIMGDIKQLSEPNTAFISRDAAKLVYGDEDPVGQILSTGMDREIKKFTIVGIMENLQPNCHIKADFIYSLNSFSWYKSINDGWFSSNFYSYIVLNASIDLKAFEKKFHAFTIDQLDRALIASDNITYTKLLEKGQSWDFYLQPIAQIHLYSACVSELNMNGNIVYVYIFLLTALLILIISTFNFANLFISKVIFAPKETAIRKISGSKRFPILLQYLSESCVLCFISLFIALSFVFMILPQFSSFTKIQFSLISISKWPVVGIFIALPILTGLLSGIYPALIVSQFSPLKILTAKFGQQRGKFSIKEVLIISQFTITIIAMIGALVISKQLNFIQNQRLGFEKENIIILQGTEELYNGKNDVFKEALLTNEDITKVSYSHGVPSTSTGKRSFENEKGNYFSFDVMVCDYDFKDVYGLQMANGRFFDKSFSKNGRKIVLNETAVKQYGLKNYIGNHWKRYSIDYEIIGVVKDFHNLSKKFEIQPTAFIQVPDIDWFWPPTYFSLKIKGTDVASTIDYAKKQWKALLPGCPFTYRFFDEEYDKMYRYEANTKTLFYLFSMIAICISCFGLFAFVKRVLMNRTKEIGIRKVNGAKVTEIIVMLNRDFVKWVLIAYVVATPIAYYALNKWLQNFAYRTELSWWVFAEAGIMAMAIALITVSWQSWRAATRNPVESLRYE